MDDLLKLWEQSKYPEGFVSYSSYLTIDGNTLLLLALKKSMLPVTERMPTIQLKEMGADGLLKRSILEELPPKVVEYQLTEKDLSLEKASTSCMLGEVNIMFAKCKKMSF